MYKRYHSFARICYKTLRWLAVITVLIMLVIMTIEVVRRYFLGRTFIWSDEVIRILLVYCAVGPFVFYKRYRYRMAEDKIEVRRGILYITHLLVPVERVHQVDVRVGPINRIFGLADVGITTAGGEVSLQFLEEDVAEGIATALNDKIVRMLKERV